MKKLLGYWNKFELVWLVSFCAIAVAITVVSGDDLFGFVVFLAGVLCVVLAAKGNILNYPIGIINSLGYGYIALQNGLYGEVGLNFLFYIPMAFVGFFLWRNHVDDAVVRMKRLSLRGVVLLVASCTVSIAAVGLAMSFIPGQNLPYIDASTNVLSIAATILMAKRFREQWACYITLNALSAAMWGFRMLQGSPEGLLMMVMWLAYLVNSCYGFYNWSKGSAKKPAAVLDAAVLQTDSLADSQVVSQTDSQVVSQADDLAQNCAQNHTQNLAQNSKELA